MPYEIEIVKGDITTVDTECIVNAANNHFRMGAGVAGAIKRAGGQVVEEEAVLKGPVMPGEAVASTAGKLPYAYVIHAAVMGQDFRTSDKLIRRATLASLTLAEKLGVKSIALPACGTGVGGFPMAACAYNMVLATRGFQSQSKGVLQRVVFCLFSELGYKAFLKEAGKSG